MEYLEKGVFYFTKIIEDNKKINEDGKEAKTIFNLDQETKKKALYEEKKDMQALLFAATHLSTFTILLSILKLFTSLFILVFLFELSTFLFAFTILVTG